MTEKGGELVWAKITLANHHPMYIGSFHNNDGPTTNVEHLDHSLDQISDLTKNNPMHSLRLAVTLMRVGWTGKNI